MTRDLTTVELVERINKLVKSFQATTAQPQAIVRDEGAGYFTIQSASGAVGGTTVRQGEGPRT